MPINWRTDYGIRLVFELSKLGDGTRTTVRRLSESANVPYDYARTIVRDLVAAGVLDSHRGVGGGVELAAPAAETTVLQVFKALGEPASLALCTDAGADCVRVETCPMHQSIWAGLDDIIVRYLADADFERIAKLGMEFEAKVAEDC